MNTENLVKYKLLNTKAITDVLAKSSEGIPLIAINKGFEGRFPHIMLHVDSGRDSGFADDNTYAVSEVVKINFFCEHEEFYMVQQALNDTMREINFFRNNYYSVTNPNTNVTQYSIYYRTDISTKMLRTQYTEQYLEYVVEVPKSQQTVLPDGEYYDSRTNETYWIVDGEKTTQKGE